MTVAVDGDNGAFLVDPDAATVARLRTRIGCPVGCRAGRVAALPAHTADGVESRCWPTSPPAPRPAALDAGAVGVGLLRPSCRSWRQPTGRPRAARGRPAPVLEVLRGRPVTVRLLDFTHDKVPPFLRGHGDASSLPCCSSTRGAGCPALRDPGHGRGLDLRLMLPMVTARTSWPWSGTAGPRRPGRRRRPAASAGRDARVPEAIDRLPDLVAAADFFSLGTNDLTAPRWAWTGPTRGSPSPRGDPGRAAAGRPRGPAHRRRRPAALAVRRRRRRPEAFPRLLATGVRTFSVAPSRLDAVRAMVRPTRRRPAQRGVGPDA
jgi:phosphoenolpyruvate-protein kinase (PTS system EI component)